MLLPVDDELYEVDQTYLDPPRRYLAPMRHKAIFAWLVIGPLTFVVTHKLGLPFTVLTVGLLRPLPRDRQTRARQRDRRPGPGAVLRRHDDAGGLVDDGPAGQGAAQVEMAAPPADPAGARGAVRAGYAASPGDCGRGRTRGGGCQAPAGGVLDASGAVQGLRGSGGPAVG